MNLQFKNEFKNLDKNDIIKYVNGCAGADILGTEFVNNIQLNNPESAYFIKYIENDDDYGFWIIEWSWRKIKLPHMIIASGFFEHSIKITPFKIEFNNAPSTRPNPYIKNHNKKQLEDYLYIYINKKCPTYKQAIIEETQKFIQKIDMFNESNINSNNQNELSK